jgi:alkanesulfonate monooxygenase SsuD/methylene tetrahydromethanopterin reductase-like flavin-dependent oxidoreductase (luciferase family)
MPMRSLVGTAAEVRDQIDDLAERSHADEVMITTFLAELEDRRRTIVALAAAFDLPGLRGVTPAL